MPSLPVRLVALLLGTAPFAACSSGGASPNVTPEAQVSAEGDTPPRMVSSGRLAVPFTTMRVVGGPGGSARTPSTGASRQPFTIAVQIDEAGRPDLSTLVVEGLSNADHEAARRGIEEWVSRARFEPARRDGVAVPGTFRRTFGR